MNSPYLTTVPVNPIIGQLAVEIAAGLLKKKEPVRRKKTLLCRSKKVVYVPSAR